MKTFNIFAVFVTLTAGIEGCETKGKSDGHASDTGGSSTGHTIGTGTHAGGTGAIVSGAGTQTDTHVHAGQVYITYVKTTEDEYLHKDPAYPVRLSDDEESTHIFHTEAHHLVEPKKNEINGKMKEARHAARMMFDLEEVGDENKKVAGILPYIHYNVDTEENDFSLVRISIRGKIPLHKMISKRFDPKYDAWVKEWATKSQTEWNRDAKWVEPTLRNFLLVDVRAWRMQRRQPIYRVT